MGEFTRIVALLLTFDHAQPCTHRKTGNQQPPHDFCTMMWASVWHVMRPTSIWQCQQHIGAGSAMARCLQELPDLGGRSCTTCRRTAAHSRRRAASCQGHPQAGASQGQGRRQAQGPCLCCAPALLPPSEAGPQDRHGPAVPEDRSANREARCQRKGVTNECK